MSYHGCKHWFPMRELRPPYDVRDIPTATPAALADFRRRLVAGEVYAAGADERRVIAALARLAGLSVKFKRIELKLFTDD